MKRFRQKLSVFILAIAALGLLSSLIHYHSETLECFEHAGTPHYKVYDVLCPVSTLHVQIDSDDPNTFFKELEFKEYVVTSDETLALQENYDSPLGRSPPSIA